MAAILHRYWRCRWCNHNNFGDKRNPTTRCTNCGRSQR